MAFHHPLRLYSFDHIPLLIRLSLFPPTLSPACHYVRVPGPADGHRRTNKCKSRETGRRLRSVSPLTRLQKIRTEDRPRFFCVFLSFAEGEQRPDRRYSSAGHDRHDRPMTAQQQVHNRYNYTVLTRQTHDRHTTNSLQTPNPNHADVGGVSGSQKLGRSVSPSRLQLSSRRLCRPPFFSHSASAHTTTT